MLLFSINSFTQITPSIKSDFLYGDWDYPMKFLKVKKVSQYSVLVEPSGDPLDSLFYFQSCNYIAEFDSVNRITSFKYNFEPMGPIESDSLIIDSTELQSTVKTYSYRKDGSQNIQIKPRNGKLDPIDLGKASLVINERRMINVHYNDVLMSSNTFEDGEKTFYRYKYQNREVGYYQALLYETVTKSTPSLNRKLTVYLFYEFYE